MERIGDLAYNPVREHIEMGFRTVKDDAQRVQAVVDNLEEQQFNPALSRVLVFVRTRQQAEDTALALNQLAERRGLPWAGHVDYFHAALDGAERSAKYEAYKATLDPGIDVEATDEEPTHTLVLVATKAFGMGMDIPNIHYLYHLGPSGTFEDFLQEVGRAGRNAAQRQQAGFAGERRIQSLCILTRADFGVLRDLLHKSDLSWQYVFNTQQQLHQHLAKMGKLQVPMTEPYALPLDLSRSGLANAAEDEVRFRLSLHWLEELGRLHLGMYTLTHLPLTLGQHPNYALIWQADERQQVQQFVEALHSSPHREANAPSLNLPLDELLRLTGQKQLSVAFRLLFKAQRARALFIDRPLWLRSTKTRKAELHAWQEAQFADHRLPLVEALFDLARRLLRLLPAGGGQRRIESSEWDELVREVAAEYFTTDHVHWAEIGAKKQPLGAPATCRKLSKDWQQKRARFALSLIRLLPGVKTKTLLDVKGPERGMRIQVISSEQGNARQLEAPLAALRERLQALLEHVVRAGQTQFNYADVVLVLELEAEGTAYVDNLLFLARSLAYLNTSGTLLPTGIELFVQDLTPPDQDDHTAALNRSVSDAQVYQKFEEGRQLKQLRLLALECLSHLATEAQDGFIKQYFGCEGSAALVGLLGQEDYLGEDHPKLQAYRGEALKEEEAKLNEQQRQVYDAPLNQHLQVIAGPGSGKTHTLILRVARLIHQENVKPEEIIILAYNRAVVVELKERLSRLFQRLGYGRLINRLHVYTFHGFCQRILGERLQGKAYDQWVPCLTQALATNPSLLQVELRQSIAYAFVDEFQDITTERLELLRIIAPPDQTKLCVIGDPNQSIYGYEKANVNEPRDPYPYYKKLYQLYQHGKPFYLSDNYRSYPAILEAGTQLLAANPRRFKNLPSLRARREPVPTSTYCEIIDVRTSEAPHWHKKLEQLLKETYQPGPDAQGRPQAAKRYQQVAVMLRSNDEVFRAYTELDKNSLLEGVTLRVQGASTSPVASREFRELLQPFYAAPEALLAPDFMESFAQEKEACLARLGHVWDPYLLHLVHCLLYEFRAECERRGEPLEEATQQELLEFITDLARHDDGHFARLYEKHIRAVAPHEPERREVILTTMHKVKGLEFDAVLLPPSFMDFGQSETEASLPEVVEEERRLLYVAYTRARYRLAVFNYERELAVAEGRPFTLGDQQRQQIGNSVKDEMGKVQLSWGADEWEGKAATYALIRDQIKVGSPITIGHDRWGARVLEWEGRVVGKIGKDAAAKLPSLGKLTGLVVSHVTCYTLADSLAYDAAKNSNYSAKWGPTARDRGYIYVVDFAGYYKEM
ncbi:UvrD-helicase domain-containing protein [Hymenobacter tenuis]